MENRIEKLFQYIEEEGGKIAVLRATIHSRISRGEARELGENSEAYEKLGEAAKKVLHKSKLPNL